VLDGGPRKTVGTPLSASRPHRNRMQKILFKESMRPALFFVFHDDRIFKFEVKPGVGVLFKVVVLY